MFWWIKYNKYVKNEFLVHIQYKVICVTDISMSIHNFECKEKILFFYENEIESLNKLKYIYMLNRSHEQKNTEII